MRHPRFTHEKISVNLAAHLIGQLDILVSEGYYRNRSDAIRRGSDDTLSRRRIDIDRVMKAGQFTTGHLLIDRARLRGEYAPVKISHVGILEIADDVDADLAESKIASVRLFGVLRVNPETLEYVRVDMPAKRLWYLDYTDVG